MKQNFKPFLRRGIVLCLSLLAFASCETSDDGSAEKSVEISTPTLADFKSAVGNYSTNFYAKNNDTLFNFLPDWSGLQTQQVGGDQANALLVPATLNATVNGNAKVVAVMVNSVLLTVIQVEHAITTDSNGVLLDGKTFYFDLEGNFIIGFVSENGIVTKKLLKSTNVNTAGFGNMLSLILAVIQDVDCDEDLWAGSIFCTNELEEVVIVASPGRVFGPIYSMVIHNPITFLPGGPIGGGGGPSCPSGMIMINGICVKAPCIENAIGNPLGNMAIEGKPLSGVDGARFGDRRGSPHNGIDIHAPVGTPVFATHNGMVNTWPFSDEHIQGELWDNRHLWNYDRNAAGNRIWIRSSGYNNVWTSGYFHLSRVLVQPGETVRVGQLIGYSGTTGSATAPGANPPHLHYELKKDGVHVDPEGVLPADMSGSDGVNTYNCN